MEVRLMKISARQRCACEHLPPFWYGLSYTDFIRDYEVYHPIPLNFIIRVARLLKYAWDRFRSRPTWIDKQITTSLHQIRLREKEYYRKYYGDREP